jgi:hypothetical protein
VPFDVTIGIAPCAYLVRAARTGSLQLTPRSSECAINNGEPLYEPDCPEMKFVHAT